MPVTGRWNKANTVAGTTAEYNWFDAANWWSKPTGAASYSALVPTSETDASIEFTNSAPNAAASYDQRIMLRGTETRNSTPNNQTTFGGLTFAPTLFPSGSTALKYTLDTNESANQYLNFSRSSTLRPYIAIGDARVTVEFSSKVIAASSKTINRIGVGTVIFNNFDPSTVIELQGGVTQSPFWALGATVNITGAASDGTTYRWKGSVPTTTATFGNLSIDNINAFYEIDHPFSATAQPTGTKVDYSRVSPSVNVSGMTSGKYKITSGIVRLTSTTVGLGTYTRMVIGADGGLQYYGYPAALTLSGGNVEGEGIFEFIGATPTNRLKLSTRFNAFSGEISVQNALFAMSAATDGTNQLLAFTHTDATQAYTSARSVMAGLAYSGARNSIVTSSTWGGATNAFTRVPERVTLALRGSANLIIDTASEEFLTFAPRRHVVFSDTAPAGYAVVQTQPTTPRYFQASISCFYDGPVTFDSNMGAVQYRVNGGKKVEHKCTTTNYGAYQVDGLSNPALVIRSGTYVRFVSSDNAADGGTVWFHDLIRGDFTVENNIDLKLMGAARLHDSRYQLKSGSIIFGSAANMGHTGVVATHNNLTLFRFDNAVGAAASYTFNGTDADADMQGRSVVMGLGSCKISSTGTKALKIRNAGILMPPVRSDYTLVLGGTSTADNELSGMEPYACTKDPDGFMVWTDIVTTAPRINIQKVDAGRWVIGGDSKINGDLLISAGEIVIDSPDGTEKVGVYDVGAVTLNGSTSTLRSRAGDPSLGGNRQLGRNKFDSLTIEGLGGTLIIGGV